MSADADQRGTLAARTKRGKPQRGAPPPSVRRAIVKLYGARSRYAMTKFERERLARREITLGTVTPEHPGLSHSPRRGDPVSPNAAPTIAVPAGPSLNRGPAGDQPEDRTP